MSSYRSRVARAIQEECSGSAWPGGGNPYQAAEREHWYACAEQAIEAVAATLAADGDDYGEWYRDNVERLDEIDEDMTHAEVVAHYLRSRR